MSAATPATEVATIVLPVVRGLDSKKNTVRLFEMLGDGKPNRDGASVWFWKEMLTLTGVDAESVQHAA